MWRSEIISLIVALSRSVLLSWGRYFREPSQLVGNASVAGAFGYNKVALVVFECQANVPSFIGLWCPRVSSSWFGMGLDLDAWWGNGIAVEVKLSVDAFPCG